MTKERGYKVSDVARTTGVSVRTLHYYDEIGLLVPTDRTPKGYRLYFGAGCVASAANPDRTVFRLFIG